MKLCYNKNILLILSALLFPIILLSTQYGLAAYPHWVGQEIILKTRPYDPRSMFRGNYARLTYDISRLPKSLFENVPKRLKAGRTVYVILEERGDIWEAKAAALEKPASGTFIKGQVASRYWTREVEIIYGIEALFLPKNEAEEIDRLKRRKAGIARIKLTQGGKAALVGIE